MSYSVISALSSIGGYSAFEGEAGWIYSGRREFHANTKAKTDPSSEAELQLLPRVNPRTVMHLFEFNPSCR